MDRKELIALHQFDPNADCLWEYFAAVMDWVKNIFIVYRKEMASVNWGWLYNRYRNTTRTPEEIEAMVSKLMSDDEVTSKKGIYTYIFTGDERVLSLRTFSDTQKRTAYEQQKGICQICGKHIDLADCHADHRVAWSRGGKTTPDNLRILCVDCNLRRGAH